MTDDPHPSADRRRPALIVSANSDIVDLYVLSLRSERRGLLSVGSLDEALQLVRDRAVSAVIVDVASPADDWETCRQLVSESQDVPVVVLTGWIEPSARAQAFELGCAAFLAKPASPESLRDVLQRVGAGERGITVIE